MGINKVRVKIFVFVLAITMLVLTPILLVCCDKPNIHNASIEELQEINGIGEELSQRIDFYLSHNSNATIDDLSNVYGVGETIICKLKERYRDD